MEDWQQRVVDEHRELCGKLTKLAQFITNDPAFSPIDMYQQNLLRRQRAAMIEYEAVLAERIKLFT